MPDPQERAALHLTEADLVLAEWGNVCFVVWRDKPTLASAKAMRERYLAMAARHPGGFLSFGVIEAGVANPGDAERAAITEAMGAAGDAMKAAAVALEATGFAAAALRAALATMSLLTRSRFPRKFVATVDEAAQWAAPFARTADGRPVSAEQLARAFQSMRAGLSRA